MTAETRVFDRLVPDNEEHFSSLVAQRLGIDLRLRPMDDHSYDPEWRSRPIRTAEPTPAIVRAHFERQIAQDMAARASVWFHGEGPDNALQFEARPYLAGLRRPRRRRLVPPCPDAICAGPERRRMAALRQKKRGLRQGTRH